MDKIINRLNTSIKNNEPMSLEEVKYILHKLKKYTCSYCNNYSLNQELLYCNDEYCGNEICDLCKKDCYRCDRIFCPSCIKRDDNCYHCWNRSWSSDSV